MTTERFLAWCRMMVSLVVSLVGTLTEVTPVTKVVDLWLKWSGSKMKTYCYKITFKAGVQHGKVLGKTARHARQLLCIIWKVKSLPANSLVWQEGSSHKGGR
jgi:hypothetical protein